MKKVKMALSPKLAAADTLQLKSMASGLRSMRGGQKHLLKLIEAELRRRERLEKGTR